MVTASVTWGSGGLSAPLSNTRWITSRRVATPPATEQQAGGVALNTDIQSVGRPMLRFSYSAISPFKSQLSPFYRGKISAQISCHQRHSKAPYRPPGVRISIGGRQTKFSGQRKDL